MKKYGSTAMEALKEGREVMNSIKPEIEAFKKLIL
jgi:hypothetical protein